jgi:hypothetical protein
MSVKFLLIAILNDCIQISVAEFNHASLFANFTQAIEEVNAGSSEYAGVGSLHHAIACICFHSNSAENFI